MKQNSQTFFNERNLIYFGFLVLGIFSVIFAEERIINSDAAFYLFKLINFENFNIEHQRYSAVISQLFVLLSVKAGIPLPWLVVIYSLSFVVLFFLVFLILRKVLNNKPAALTILLVLVAGVSHIKYRPVSESTQGLVYSLLLFGLLYHYHPVGIQKMHVKIKFYAASIFVIALCYFSHPITIFPLLFILVYYLVDTKSYYKPEAYILFFLIILLFASRLLMDNFSSYEDDKIGNPEEYLSSLNNFFKLYPTKFIIDRIYPLYLIPLLLWIFIMVRYFHTREYIKLLILNLFFLGFIVIHNLIYHVGASDIEHEKNLMTANFILFLAFSNDIFYKPGYRIHKSIFLFVIILFSSYTIFKSRKSYENRIHYLKFLSYQVLGNQNGTKYYTLDSEKVQKNSFFKWSVPFETLLFSSYEGPEYSKTLYVFSNNEEIPDFIHNKDLYLCTTFWKRFNINDLNSDYFRLPPEEYKCLSLPDFKTENK